MNAQTLIDQAHELEWLGCELEYYGQRHAHEGFPGVGPTWEAFLEKRRGVLLTAAKIERELTNAVRFNPARLVGTQFALDEALDAITQLLAEVETIKQMAIEDVQSLPARVRGFTKAVHQAFTESEVFER